MIAERSDRACNTSRRAACVQLATTVGALTFVGLRVEDALATPTLPETARDTLRERGLILDTTQLTEFENARVVANRHISIVMAVRHPKIDLEIRYSCHELVSGPGRIPLVAQAEGLFLAGTMNMADPRLAGNMERPQPFPADAVKAEFNADAGWTTVITPRPDFTRASAALVNGIYSEKWRSLGWAIFLFQAKPTGMSPDVEAALGTAFHALRFAK